jgi:hypothetical protein
MRRNSSLSWLWDEKKLLFETLIIHITLYGYEVHGCSISIELCRKIEHIQKHFVTYNLKIKGNTTYPILLIEASLSLVENMAMNGYLMYKNKIKNMEDNKLSKIALKYSQKHLCSSRLE